MESLPLQPEPEAKPEAEPEADSGPEPKPKPEPSAVEQADADVPPAAGLFNRTSDFFGDTSPSRPATTGTTGRRGRDADGAWVPPPGAFNEPDLPIFPGPGPGRYTPITTLTRPRTATTSFPTEDRWKHLGRQRDSTRALDGATSTASISTWGPQIGVSPGPVYLPVYTATEIQSRSMGFPSQARTKSASLASAVASSKRPGPGTYSPIEQFAVLSTKPRVGRMSPFSIDDRLKYLGVQLEGGVVVQIASPGPTYAPKLDLVLPFAGGVAFGQPRSRQQKAMIGGHASPGPGSYSPAAQAAVLSSKPTVPSSSFGKEKRFHGGAPGQGDALLTRRPTTPGPKYLPNFEYVRPQSRSAAIGTSKRFSRSNSLA
mmetsp:Transcript_20207/g.51404  ORF Transcript_20207/g.51404 Transcript_20207/m.51404 type:complete len:372 (+) Transcript_20207:89-1204(+)